MTLQQYTRIAAALLAAAVTLVLAACGNGWGSGAVAPTGPPPQVSPADDPNSPSVRSSGAWTVTQVGVSVSGNTRCFVTQPTISSSATQDHGRYPGKSTVEFVEGEDYDFTGSTAGDTFAAAEVVGAGHLAVTGQQSCSWDGVFSVVGTFSADGRHLTAQETDVEHWPDGDVITTFNWTADHQ